MTEPMSHDAYLAARPEDQRAALERVRRIIADAVPDAVEVMSYAMPGFRRPGGKVFAGYAGFARNCGYYPHSGNILPAFADQLAPWKHTRGAVQFTPATPLPEDLIRALIAARLAEIR